MGNNVKYIDLRIASRTLEIAELRIWQLIRQHLVKSRVGCMRKVEVDIYGLTAFERNNPETVAKWRDAFATTQRNYIKQIKTTHNENH